MLEVKNKSISLPWELTLFSCKLQAKNCYVVEPPYATTYPKHQNFPSQSLPVGTSCQRPPPVGNRERYLGFMV